MLLQLLLLCLCISDINSCSTEAATGRDQLQPLPPPLHAITAAAVTYAAPTQLSAPLPALSSAGAAQDGLPTRESEAHSRGEAAGNVKTSNQAALPKLILCWPFSLRLPATWQPEQSSAILLQLAAE